LEAALEADDDAPAGAWGIWGGPAFEVITAGVFGISGEAVVSVAAASGTASTWVLEFLDNIESIATVELYTITFFAFRARPGGRSPSYMWY
jgi:hypothetical protein